VHIIGQFTAHLALQQVCLQRKYLEKCMYAIWVCLELVVA